MTPISGKSATWTFVLALYAENCSRVQNHQSMRMQTAGLVAPVIIAGWIAVVYNEHLGGPIDGIVLAAMSLLSLITFIVMVNHHRKVAELDRFQVGILNALAGVAGGDTCVVLPRWPGDQGPRRVAVPSAATSKACFGGYIWAWFTTFFFLSTIFNGSLSDLVSARALM